jgi:hypothetical protein
LFPFFIVARIPRMKPFLRRPDVRLALVVAGLVVALLVLRSLTGGSTEQEPFQSVADVPEIQTVSAQAQMPVAPPALTLDALGAPDDPLPAPFPVPATELPMQADEAAETLARQVLAGTQDSLPALIAALQASGIGIIGPGNSVDAKPAAPWQGMIMQRWEVRTAAAMVLPARTVTLTLADLAAFLVAVVPDLKGAPVEQLLVKDLRGLADSQAPPRRFFGQFIAALGRNANRGGASDLFGGADPQTIQIDGLQASLILRRLSIDVLMSSPDAKASMGANDQRASFFDTLQAWLSPTVHAQGQPPCRLSERTQTIMDIAAFGSSLVWGGVEVGELATPALMQRFGIARLGSAAAVASTLLAYAQFIATFSSLEADVTMDGAPLVRTKKRSPRTGERRALSAVVRFNVGNAQMLNCFRALLIAVGLDFSLPNNGPVKGARVAWYGVDGFDQSAAVLHGGSEAIVQFVAPEASRIQGGGSAGTSPVTNAVTPEDGKVQIDVEGRGQREDLPEDATSVGKSAKVRLHVALKGADLFGDLQEAAGTAAGGLVALSTVPLSVLTRAQWASVGHYTFPVTDWRDGPGRWTGTITHTTSEIRMTEGESPEGGGRSQETLTEAVEITVTDTTGEQSSGTAVSATLKGRATGKINRQATSSSWYLMSCGNGPKIRLTGSNRDFSNGQDQSESTLDVVLTGDGSYTVLASIAGLKVTVTGETSGVSQRLNDQCGAENVSASRAHVPHEQILAAGSIGVTGKVAPDTPYLLEGTKSEDGPLERIDEQTTLKRVRTTKWNLRRN